MASTIRNLRVALSMETTGVEKGAAKVQAVTGRLEKTFGRLAQVGATLGVAFGAGAIVDFARQSIKAASDLSESMSKVGVVFGESRKIIDDFAASSATSMGLSRQAALEATGTLGNLFVSMKIGQPEAAKMSVSMVRLAGDLASFNNVKPEEALEALRAGLVGETEPLRRFGINLNDATLRAETMRLGLGKIGATLTPLQKSQAAYSLILQQSATAQGDFARTSGGLANQQRILTAQFEDTKAELGQKLLPVALKVTAWFNTDLIPALRSTITWMGENETLIRNVAIAVGAGVVIWAAYTAAVKTAAVSSAVLAGASRAVAFLSSAWETLRLKQMLAADAIRDAGGPVQALKSNIGGMSGAVSKAKGALSGLLGVVGGPWGLAVAAGAVALGIFASRNAESKARVDDLTEALARNKGVLDDSAKATVHKTLLDQGALGAARDLGIQLDLVSRAALGDKQAMAELNAQLDRFTDVTKGANVVGGSWSAIADTNVRAANMLRDSVGGTNNELAESHKKYRLLNEVTPKAATGAENVATGFHQIETSADKAAGKVGDLNNKIGGFKNLTADADLAAIDFRDAVDNLSEAFKKNGTQIDSRNGKFKISNERGRENNRLLIEAARKAADHAQKVFEQTGNVDKANRVFRTHRDRLQDALEKTGRNKQAVQDLINKYLKMPDAINGATNRIKDKTVSIKVNADGRILSRLGGGRMGLATGGILPGYTPGRDVHEFYSPTGGRLGLSGGEAVMRPEWTKAIGPAEVERLNAAARTGGVRGVKKVLAGGVGPGGLRGEGAFFANGGIISRHSITGMSSVKSMVSRYDQLLTLATGKAAARLVKKLNELYLGGPGVQNALKWARTQNGKPYVWGGVGPRGYDCSGWTSALTNIIQGRRPHQRRHTTHSFGARGGPDGFVRNRSSGFRVGVTDAGVGHMAGTLGKVNVESSGSRGVRVGGGARGANSGLFTRRYGLKFDQGGVLPPGHTPAYNGTGKPEYVFTQRQMQQGGGRPVEVHNHFHIPNHPNRQAIAKEIYEVLEPYMKSSGRRLPT